MAGFIRVAIDVPGLVAAIVAYLNDPRPDRNVHHADLLSDEVERQVGLTQDVLEALLLEGASEATDVAPLVAFLANFGGEPAPAPTVSTIT